MKVLDKKTLWQGRFIKTVLITYEDKHGKIRTWEAVERVDCDGVVLIVPVTNKGELILIRQFRPVLDKYVIELPAGLVEPGESVIEACRRELIEETGYATDDFAELSEGVISTGLMPDLWKVFLAKDVMKASPEQLASCRPDDNEDISVLSVPIDNVLRHLQKIKGPLDHVDLRILGMIELAKIKLGAG